MRTTTVVVGGGQSGLAMSQCLSVRSIDHVILERNEVANSWRRERWDSLRLLTPNWQCRLPGFDYRGDDPDGFMSALQVADFIAEYAKVIAAPVMDGTTVTSVRRTDDGVPGHHRAGGMDLSDGRRCYRSVQPAERAGLRQRPCHRKSRR